jgi:predicted PurR-regulated permease PerM
MEVPAAQLSTASAPPPSRRVLVLLAGTAIGVGLLWLGRDVLAPFVVGLLVVYLLDPIVERLARVKIGGRRAPRALLILLVYIVVALVVTELFLLVIGPLVEQLRAFVEDAPGYYDMLNERVGEVFAWWDRLDLPADVKAAVDEGLRDLLASIGSLVPAVVRPIFTSVLGLVGSVFGYLIIPVWAFWILKDRPMIVRAFDRSLPTDWRADTWAILSIVRRVFGSWIRGQIVLGIVVGVATFIGLMVLGEFVDPVFSRYAVLLAVIAGFLELLPIIGPIIAAIPAVLLGATAGVSGFVAALLLYFAIQQVENTVLVPKIQGDATRLHPSVVIFSLILGGAIAGLLGAILALPVAATLRDIYIYAFRRAEGMSSTDAATGHARPARDGGPKSLEATSGSTPGIAAGDAGAGEPGLEVEAATAPADTPQGPTPNTPEGQADTPEG